MTTMARPSGHKEEYIFDFITRLGTVVYDNDPNARKPTAAVQPIKGVTTGRNYKGELNGSMTVDDIFDIYAAVLLNGFTPDTMLVHPCPKLMWVKDPCPPRVRHPGRRRQVLRQLHRQPGRAGQQVLQLQRSRSRSGASWGSTPRASCLAERFPLRKPATTSR
jgi:hypothetical protein